MKGGNLLYKCRRCGALSVESHAPDLGIALACAIVGSPMPESLGSIPPRMYGVHRCFPSVWGVADLIGGDEDK